MGTLSGIKIVEFAGLGPAPFAAMMLADHGAQVIKIGRKMSKPLYDKGDVLSRSKLAISLDLKDEKSIEIVKKLIAEADGLIEGFRPGVMEKMGLGPEECLKLNPRLVYGRMTGWGQDGPYAKSAGHDVNYIALSGALHTMANDVGPKPVPGLVGDFGGGGMLLAFGMVCALLEAKSSGQGQVVDAAITDGSALLNSLQMGWYATGQWKLGFGTHIGNGAAPFFNTYECADGKYISIGPIEDKFYQTFLELCKIDDPLLTKQWDVKNWPNAKEFLKQMFKSKTRDAWCELLEETDACFAPVLDMEEAPKHPHNVLRKTFSEVDGVVQPSPAPKFSRTPSAGAGPVKPEGADTEEVLKSLGLTQDEINQII